MGVAMDMRTILDIVQASIEEGWEPYRLALTIAARQREADALLVEGIGAAEAAALIRSAA